MPGKKLNQLNSGALALTRLLGHSDPATGIMKKATLQALVTFLNANLDFTGGGGNSSSVNGAVNGRAIDFEGAQGAYIELLDEFDVPDAIVLTNESEALELNLLFQVTEFTALVTFPVGFLSHDPRFNNGSRVFTAGELGLYSAYAWTPDHVNWYIEIAASPIIIAS